MRTVVGIFAHPDDEALGPSGTIAKFAKNHDVYIICVTNGDASGKTTREKKQIGAARKNELLHSAKILGVKKVFFLEYPDGELRNNIYHELAEKIKNILEKLQPLTVITFEPRGVSGHIDHITISMVTSYVFEKAPYIKTIMYYCLNEKHSLETKNYFIYFPDGYKQSEIDKVVDIKDVWEIKVKAAHAHQSQIHDVERVLARLRRFPKVENFLLRKRS